MKSLKMCANGCDAPVCSPSRVICRSCMDKITANLEEIGRRMAPIARGEERTRAGRADGMRYRCWDEAMNEHDLTDDEIYRLEFLYEHNLARLGDQYEKAARMMALTQILLERKPKRKRRRRA